MVWHVMDVLPTYMPYTGCCDVFFLIVANSNPCQAVLVGMLSSNHYILSVVRSGG